MLVSAGDVIKRKYILLVVLVNRKHARVVFEVLDLIISRSSLRFNLVKKMHHFLLNSTVSLILCLVNVSLGLVFFAQIKVLVLRFTLDL